MYLVTLKIYNSDSLELLNSFILGTFNRPSTAERLRKQFEMNNPQFNFVLNYESVS